MTRRAIPFLQRALLSQLLLLSVLTGCGPDEGGRLDVGSGPTISGAGGAPWALAGTVQWSVSAGSITSTGLYSAPAQVGTYQVQATYGGRTGFASAIVGSGPGVPAANAPPQDFYNYASSTCASMPLRSTGTIRYFCDCQAGAQSGCVPGNDANAGTSPSAPKRRWYAAAQAFNAMNAGDTVALCKGGAWNLNTGTGTCGSADPGGSNDSGSAYFQNPRCAAGTSLTDPANTSTCDIRDYQASWGGTNKPRVAIGTTATTVILGRNGANTTGVRVMNLEFRGGNAGPRGGVYNDLSGLWQGSCGSTTDTSWLICNNTFTNLARGLHLEENGARSYNLHVWGNRFLMHDQDAILGGPGSGGRIDANFFDNNGGFGRPNGGPAHTLYPNGVNGSPGAQIINNEIRYSSVPCENAVISGHQQFDGLNVENNLIDCGTLASAGCWGMKLDSGNNSGGTIPHYQRNVHVHRNRIYSNSVGIGLGQAPGALVENNVVVMTGSSTWKRGILVPSEGNYGWDITSRVTARNNSIYVPTNSPNSAAIEIGLTAEAGQSTGHVIANNAVHTGGSSSVCFVTPLAAGAYSFVGNNACYQGTWGTSYDGTTHITASPMFTNAPVDFMPATGSRLVGVGSATYSPTTDYMLKRRSNPPTIGAYEP